MVKIKKQKLFDKKAKALQEEMDRKAPIGFPPEPLTPRETGAHKETWAEILIPPIAVVTLLGVIIVAIPWVLNAAFWLAKAFFDYWGWVNKFF